MKTTGQLVAILSGVALLMATIFMFAAFSGTILYFIYPHIHALFPTAAAKGIITQNLSWWDAVCVTWIFGILLKSSTKSESKSEK